MRASDFMTPRVTTIRDDIAIDEAIRIMLDRRISGLPVVDVQGGLVGIVTEGDFLRRVETGTERHRPRWLEFLVNAGKLADEYVQSHGRRVDEVMTREVVTVTESTPIEELVELMERHRIKRLPVVRDNKVVGIVCRSDLMHVIATLAKRVSRPPSDDATIRAQILAELDLQSWISSANVNPIVSDGVVDFHGAIFDERHRQALRVLAENVAGVKRVDDHLVWVEPASGYIVP